MHAFNCDIDVRHRMVLYEGAEVSTPSFTGTSCMNRGNSRCLCLQLQALGFQADSCIYTGTSYVVQLEIFVLANTK